MEATVLKRKFMYNGQELVDVDPAMSAQETRDFYSMNYPELATADVVETINDEFVIYTFNKSVGTKG
jgi:PRTRC genetic system protein C